MQTDDIFNLVSAEWPTHNQQVLRYCKLQAEAFVRDHLRDYPPTHHYASVRGNMLWDQLDYFLERAAGAGLFHGIHHEWINYKGADILTSRGKRTSLTAKHVLSKDEVLADSENGYRTNNKIKNQRNLELFEEFAAEPQDEPLHIVWQHGGKDDIFGFLNAYFSDSYPLTLSDNIMLLPDLDEAADVELVFDPLVALKSPELADEPSVDMETEFHAEEDDSQS